MSCERSNGENNVVELVVVVVVVVVVSGVIKTYKPYLFISLTS